MDTDAKFARRVHLEQAARQGNRRAQALLDGPPFPEDMAYLYRWLIQVHGRSGVDMGGLSPLSYATLDAWCRLTGAEPMPFEVDALLTLDAVMRHPEADTDA